MKFKIQKDDLARALRFASSASSASDKTSSPILQCAILRATKTGLLVTASDLTVSVRIALSAAVEREGDIAVDAHQMHAVVKALSEDDAVVEVDKAHRVTIKAGHSTFALVGRPAKDYPTVPVEAQGLVQVDAPVLREMIRLTSFSVSRDSTRLHLTGLQFESKQGNAVCVATDGFRMAKVGRNLPGSPECAGALVPLSGTREILRLLEGRESPVGFAITSDYLHIQADDVSLAVKLICDIRFPPWADLIPKNPELTVVVSRMHLLAALSRANIMSDRTRSVDLTLSASALTIGAENPDRGNHTEEIEAKVTGGAGGLAVKLNGAYLHDWLTEASSEMIRMGFNGPLDPVVLQPDDNVDYVGVVMPIR